jgi:hypothetical protein
MRQIACLILVGSVGSFGCARSNPVETPPSFQELYDGFVQTDRDIQNALAENPPGDVHDLVHDAGHLASALAEVDSQTGLCGEQCTEVHNIAQDLLAAYGALDESIETGVAPDYESVRQRIQSGIGGLQAIANDLK